MIFLRVLSVVTLFLGACATRNVNESQSASSRRFPENFSVNVSRSVFETERLAFQKHEGSGPFGSYVSFEVPFAPIKVVYEQILKHVERPLKNRGEAHVTVITPPEFDKILKSKLSIREIDAMVESTLQKSKFEVVCVGRGELALNSKLEETYFVVVKSADLLGVRKRIAAEFEKRGGVPGKFKTEEFFPHITLGFTERDLHFEDGVRKDEKSCVVPIKVTE